MRRIPLRDSSIYTVKLKLGRSVKARLLASLIPGSVSVKDAITTPVVAVDVDAALRELERIQAEKP